MRTGTVVGFESLVRWRHPERGVVMPDEFLPVVENTGLITPLTLTVLDLALGAVAGWRAAGHDLTVAVNLSVRHLTDLGLPAPGRRGAAQARAAAERARARGHRDADHVATRSGPTDVLRLLRELGVALAVDDFGTGYSSLAYLRRLDVHELKIDRSFVRHITDRRGPRDDRALDDRDGPQPRPAAWSPRASRTRQTLDLLRGWGCDVAQGYHLSRPLDLDAVLPWLADRPTRRLEPVARRGAPTC